MSGAASASVVGTGALPGWPESRMREYRRTEYTKKRRDVDHRHVLISIPVSANDMMAFCLEAFCKVAGNETTSSGNTDSKLLMAPIRLTRIRR